MSNLNPGGSRGKGARIFGAKAIAKVCESKQYDPSGSIADKPHTHSRERERHLRQQAARIAKGLNP